MTIKKGLFANTSMVFFFYTGTFVFDVKVVIYRAVTGEKYSVKCKNLNNKSCYIFKKKKKRSFRRNFTANGKF